MKRVCGRDLVVLKVIELAYAATTDGEMMGDVFNGLRELIPFSSAVFMPVLSETLELQPGMCFDCSSADMDLYLTHYAPLDPFVLRRPSPALLNQTIRFSDVVTCNELGRSEFSDFLRRVPYHHALATLMGLAEQPVAILSLHRQARERDFRPGDQEVLDRVAPHLARAITLRHQISDRAERAETGILVFGTKGNVRYLNGAARHFLGRMPPQALLDGLSAQNTSVITLGAQGFRISQLPWTTASLLRRFAIEEAAASQTAGARADSDLAEAWSTATRLPAGAKIVAMRPFRQRVDLARRIAHYGLSPRQSEIAVWALRGLANKDIASRLFITEQTVKEHFQEIYCRAGVRTRSEFLAKVLWTGSAVPKELCGSRGSEQP